VPSRWGNRARSGPFQTMPADSSAVGEQNEIREDVWRLWRVARSVLGACPDRLRHVPVGSAGSGAGRSLIQSDRPAGGP